MTIAAAGAAAATSAALSAPGDLDPTFGNGGRVIVDIENDNDSPAGVLVEPDGKIVVGRENSADTDDFSVLRFNPDGSPDATFGAGGRSSLDIPGIDGRTRAVVRQPDGKIVAVGFAFESTEPEIPRLGSVRYLGNGSPDSTFGVGGVAIHRTDVRYQSLASAALQPDGRLLVGGNAFREGSSNRVIAVARLEPDGSLDRSFGEDGYAFGTGDTWEYMDELSLQSDGGLLVFADVESVASKEWYDSSPTIMRFRADGSPDTSFGTHGRAPIVTEASLAAVAALSDGRMVLAISNEAYPWDYFFCGAALTLVHPDGRTDDSFGIDGLKKVPLGACETFGGAMLIDPIGNIVIDGGKSTDDIADQIIDSADYVVTRLDASGDLDASFGVSGQAVVDVGDGPYLPYADNTGNLARQDDGKLVVATSGIRALTLRGDDTSRMVLARLLASGESPGLIGIKAVDPRVRDGVIPILVRRSGGSLGVVSVDYSTSGAAGSQGFVPVAGTLVWSDGDRADKLIELAPGTAFTLSLANATGGAELAMRTIQIEAQRVVSPLPSAPMPDPNRNVPMTGGGGAVSWEALALLALAGLLRLAWSSRARR